jgi:hypothetical protein
VRVTSLQLSEWVVREGGLPNPERVVFYADSRVGALLNLWNLVTGRDCSFVVTGRKVYFSHTGMFRVLSGKLDKSQLIQSLRYGEKNWVRGLLHSLAGCT